MRVSLELKDLAKYPFLRESQQFMGASADSLEDFLQTAQGKIAVRHAVGRIHTALGGSDRAMEAVSLPSDSIDVRIAVSGYVLARILVSCAADRSLVERLARFEAHRAYGFLIDEDDPKKTYIAASVGMGIQGPSLPLVQYVEIIAGLHEERWRLVNRDVHDGMVTVTPQEKNELLREQIRVILLRQLPLRVPAAVCGLLAPRVEELKAAYQKTILEQFGAVEEDCFPPCMQALIAALSTGANIPHTGRFALTAFLVNIGMAPARIIELYCRAPDFDIAKTQYQVGHIAGRGGTDYTAPSCAAMRTSGICIRSDGICSKVNHPLNYYRWKKRKGEKRDPTPPSSG